MCSICGGNLKASQVAQASALMAHRGRDASGIYSDSFIALAHNRLAILDLSARGNQPMEYGNLVLILNGEIYNYRELKSELKRAGEAFEGSSDTEVLLRALACFGVRATLPRLSGMFAFALYDKSTHKLYLARDPFGKKPLYYALQGKKILFASEIKAILLMLEHVPQANLEAISEYLSYLAPCGENSAFEGISKIPAGCYGVLESESFHLYRYYDLTRRIKPQNRSAQEAQEEVSALLQKSLEYRLNADVKVGSLLSGGLDSSLLSALAMRQMGKDARNFETFSIGYDEFLQYSELPFAREVSEHIGSIHHEIIASKHDFLETFEEVIQTIDEPINDPALIPTFLLSRALSRHGFKVVLSGEGSDELFFGYRDYYRYLEFLSTQNIYSTKEAQYKRRVECEDSPLFRVINETWQGEDKGRLFHGAIPSDRYFARLFRASGLSEGHLWCSYADFSHWIPEVLMNKVDRMSMAHALEVRAPFLDTRLVEYALSLPQEVRVGSTPKSLLKGIAKGIVPDGILARDKKGFSSPLFEWYFSEYGDQILQEYLRVNKMSGYFRAEFLHFLYREGRMGRMKSQNWSMIMLCKWFLKYFS